MWPVAGGGDCADIVNKVIVVVLRYPSRLAPDPAYSLPAIDEIASVLGRSECTEAIRTGSPCLNESLRRNQIVYTCTSTLNAAEANLACIFGIWSSVSCEELRARPRTRQNADRAF